MSFSRLIGNKVLLILTALLALCWAGSAYSQDAEPRRWTPLPTGVNFGGVIYSYTDGDIFFDPILRIEDGTYETHTAVLSYMRTLDFLGKSARVDFILPYASGRWQGDVNGEFTHIRRRGPGDARARFSVLLYGGPAETPQEFATSKKSDTVVGAALAVTMPTGDYNSERLINLGSNRWTFRPQLGVTHTWGKWTCELTGSVYFYTDNNQFFQETRLETDPLLEVQAHLIYSFRPGLWTSLSTAYGWGGEGTINGDAKNNPSGNWLTALSVGVPINRLQGFKVVWLRGRTQKPTGADMDSLGLAWTVMF